MLLDQAPILAHFGHWWSSLVFAVPFVLLVGLLTVGRLYERHRDQRPDGDPDSPR